MIAEARITGLSLATRERLSPSDLKERIDLPRVERAVREILLAIGEDPDRDGLLDTPQTSGPILSRTLSWPTRRSRNALAAHIHPGTRRGHHPP